MEVEYLQYPHKSFLSNDPINLAIKTVNWVGIKMSAMNVPAGVAAWRDEERNMFA